MNQLFDAAKEFHVFCEAAGLRYCTIGALAVLRWGEPRATQDVDFSVFVDIGNEAQIVDSVLAQFKGRTPDAAQFALTSRVLLAAASNGVALDISLAAIPFEERMFQRATPFEFATGIVLSTVSAEDLVILKAVASRPKDWVDIHGVLIRQHGALDWDLILTELQGLCHLTANFDPANELESARRKTESLLGGLEAE